MGSIAVLASLTLAASTLVADAQDIREQARKHGSIEVLLLNEYSPVDLSTLVENAGTIGRVLVNHTKSSIVGQRISTEYTVQVLTIIKGDRDLEGKTVTVRRPGGTVAIEGKTVTARDPDFPQFELGEEYVLFLKRAAEGHFTVSFGAQGAFKVEQGNVSQVSQDTGTWNGARGSVSLLNFLSEISSVRDKKH